MIEVSMAPLAPKLKRETRDGESVIVARCGVRDCPERLAELPTQRGAAWRIRFADGYELSPRHGCWRKTRRAATRSKLHRDFAYSVIECEKEDVYGTYIESERRLNDCLNALPPNATESEILDAVNAVDFSDLKAIEASIEARNQSLVKSRDVVISSEPLKNETGPFVVKCARCGRFSKISLSAGK
jgi:hypothetical protein